MNTQALMADYVVGRISCQHKVKGKKLGFTYFVVQGVGNKKDKFAMTDFLNAEYADLTYKYCTSKQVYGQDAIVYGYDTKAKANKKFSKLINDYKHQNYITKIVTVSHGYYEDDWK